MFDIGLPELILIFLIVLLLFGGKKLPELSRSLGESIKEFRQALKGEAKPKKNDKEKV